MARDSFIGLDWGTTSFRAYLVQDDGTVAKQVSASEGILAIKDGKFTEALEAQIAGWDISLPVIASGMITSRQGWVEVPYVDCPAGPFELAKAIVSRHLASGRKIHFLPGLHLRSATLGHDVMRSEEAQVFGSLESGARHFVTPGTHSKWIDVEKRRIVNFTTYVTGEVFAVLRAHSILGRLMTADDDDEETFLKGVSKAAADPAGLLHNLFSVRSLGLYDEIQGDKIASYMSGLIIGTEISHALMSRDRKAGYVVLASAAIGGRYLRAMRVLGVKAELGDPLAIVKGEAIVAKLAGIIS